VEIDLRWPLLLLCNCLLVLLLRLLNDVLGSYGITLFLSSLFLLLPALYLRLRWGFLLVTLTAVMQAAYAPIAALNWVPLYAFGLTALHANRVALRRANTGQLILVLLLANTLLWLLVTLLFGRGWLGSGAYWLRSGGDLLFSTLLLPPFALWFLAAERGLLLRFASTSQPEAP